MMHDEVMIGVVHRTTCRSRANDQQGSVLGRSILHAVSSRDTSLPGSGIALTKQRLLIFDKDQFPLKNEDQLVLGLVPMSERRARARWQSFQMYPELG